MGLYYNRHSLNEDFANKKKISSCFYSFIYTYITVLGVIVIDFLTGGIFFRDFKKKMQQF